MHQLPQVVRTQNKIIFRFAISLFNLNNKIKFQQRHLPRPRGTKEPDGKEEEPHRGRRSEKSYFCNQGRGQVGDKVHESKWFSLGCSLNLKNGLAREYSLTSLVLLTSSLTCLDSTKQFNLLLI